MNDRELEALLNRYRPTDPPPSLEDRLHSRPIPAVIESRSPRTWPWAVAAAALLVITVGLQAFSLAASLQSAEEPLDPRRVEMVAEEVGGADARIVAEFIVRREQRADAEAAEARMRAEPAGLEPR